MVLRYLPRCAWQAVLHQVHGHLELYIAQAEDAWTSRCHHCWPHISPRLRVRRRVRRVCRSTCRVRGTPRQIGEPRWEVAEPKRHAGSFEPTEATNTVPLNPVAPARKCCGSAPNLTPNRNKCSSTSSAQMLKYLRGVPWTCRAYRGRSPGTPWTSVWLQTIETTPAPIRQGWVRQEESPRDLWPPAQSPHYGLGPYCLYTLSRAYRSFVSCEGDFTHSA
jgi:hypothetical protein